MTEESTSDMLDDRLMALEKVKVLTSRFRPGPPEDLANGERTILKAGLLHRQASKRAVERYCVLFTDMFIFTEVVAGDAGGKVKGLFGKMKKAATSSSSSAAAPPAGVTGSVALDPSSTLEMKQQIDLASLRLDSRTAGVTDIPFSFLLVAADRTYAVSAGTPDATQEWIDAIVRAVKTLMIGNGGAEAAAAFKPSFWHTYLHIGTLHWAAASCEEDELRTMIAAAVADGRSVDVKDADGNTPLHYALQLGSAEMVRQLIVDGNADPSQMIYCGTGVNDTVVTDTTTPIFHAATHGQHDVVAVLLQAGVSAESMQRHRSVLWCAVNHTEAGSIDNVSAVISELCDNGAFVDECDDVTSLSLLQQAVKRLLPADQVDEDDHVDDDADGSNSSSSSSSSSTASSGMSVAEHNDIIRAERHRVLEGVIDALLSVEASVTVMDARMRTPLHDAVRAGHSAVVLALLQHGAQPCQGDLIGNTPLHYSEDVAISKLLCSYGARTDIVNRAKRAAASYFQDIGDQGTAAAMLATAAASHTAKKEERGDGVVCDSDDVTWTPDSASDTCMLCKASWSLKRRRHHCRRCGLLVCTACSARKFVNTKKSTPAAPQLDRCCDGCFNHLARANGIRKAKLASAKARSEQRREAAAAAAKKNIEKDKALNGLLAGRAGGGRKGGDAATGAHGDTAAAIGDQMNKNKAMLLKQQEQLKEMEDKTEKMADDAQNFSSMASALKNRYK